MENTVTTAAARTDRVVWRRLLWATPFAAVAAAAANALIYALASALGTLPDDVLVSSPAGEEAITAAPVITSTIVGALGAGVVFAIIAWLTARPVRTFRIVALVLLVLSLASPFSIPDAPADMIATLILMHVVAGAVIIGLLTTLVRRK